MQYFIHYPQQVNPFMYENIPWTVNWNAITLRYTLQCAHREGELPDSCWPHHIGIAESVMTHRVARPPQMHKCFLCPYFIDPYMVPVPLLYDHNTVMQGSSKIWSGCKVFCRVAFLATASVASLPLTSTWCGNLYDFFFALVTIAI